MVGWPAAVEGRDVLDAGEGVEQANKRPHRRRQTTKTAPPLKLAAMLTGALPSWHGSSSWPPSAGLASSPPDCTGKREGDERAVAAARLTGPAWPRATATEGDDEACMVQSDAATEQCVRSVRTGKGDS